MTDQIGLRLALANCLPRLRRYWKPLVFCCVPLTFGIGVQGVQTAEEPVKLVSVFIGGVVLGFVAGLAAVAERFESWAAGAPFMTLGLFTGAAFSLAGLSLTLFGAVAAFLLATAAGLLCGLAAQRP